MRGERVGALVCGPAPAEMNTRVRSPLTLTLTLSPLGRGDRTWLAMAAVLVHPLAAIADPSSASSDAYLGFEHPLPAWAWMGIVIGCVSLAGWSYHRLLGSRGARLGAAVLRSLVLLAIALLLAGPVRIDPDERDEPDVVVVLVDRSASMAIGDVADGDAAVTRDEAIRRALVEQAAVFGEGGLNHGARRMVWLGFGEDVRELPPMTDPAAWERPEAQADEPATALRTALERALREGGGRPLASIVLITDGRSPESTGVELVRRVAQRGTRVHVVPVGAAEPPFDLAVGQIEAPDQAFANDVVPISVSVDRSGGAAGGASGGEPGGVRVRLMDVETGEEIDARDVAGDAVGPVRLTARSERAGPVRYRVVVEAGGRRELMLTNNSREFVVEMLDRPVRVLYVEGYPRWEYRYLKNLLLREESIESSVLLLSADQNFAQEGDLPITRPPSTPEEIRRYDVVILGDVPPGYFAPEQLQLMRDHVAANGAGLLWIGGSRHTPASYAGTALADLLPMRSPSGVAPFAAVPTVGLEPTPLAEALYILRLRGPGGEPGEETGGGLRAEWPADLPPLRWVQQMGPLKPTAEVLAHAPAVADEAGRPLPLLARLRYGAGQSLFLGTDETWRWRYGRGELYFEQFWVQLVRMLGRERVQSGPGEGVGGRLTVSRRQATVSEPVVVELTLDERAAPAAAVGEVAVTVRRAGEMEGIAADALRLQPVPGEEGDSSMGRRLYRAVWRPGATGELVLRVTEPALDALGLERAIEVLAADDELRQVEPDHARLAALAEATGGEVVPLDALDRLVPAVPNLAEKIAMDVREPLWNSWLSLLMVVGLLTAEWLVRKAIWLV